MTIDERFDRLTEQHEALKETVEHLAIQSEERNKRIDKLDEAISRLLDLVEKMVEVKTSQQRRLAKHHLN
jgi:septation ring formation regulator EzrA